MKSKIVLDTPVKKEEEYTVHIEEMGVQGEGIGRVDGYTLFVKGALPGEQVRVKVIKTKKNYGYARLLEVLSPSPFRLDPRCPIARQCGGCQLQHCAYEQQLSYKQDKIKNCLERIGKFENMEGIMEPIMGMEEPFFYRNKAQYPMGRDKFGKIIAGFYAGRSHQIIEASPCYIQDPVNETILEIVKSFMEEYHVEPYDEQNHKGVVRHVMTRTGFVTKEVMVCLVINKKDLPFGEELVTRLKDVPGMTSVSYSVNREETNVIMGQQVKLLWGLPYITDYIGSVKYRISPLSFYQVNPLQTRKLYETALEFCDLQGDEVVWDLYCGIGTISLFLAQKACKVYGVEIVPQAIEDAKVNREINGISNVEFYVGAAEEVLPSKYEKTKEKPHVIVVDPPRKGCDQEVLDTILKMAPNKVVYVSCDPATLARDLRILCDGGYRLERVRGCDMFGQTVHVETVCLLLKKL